MSNDKKSETSSPPPTRERLSTEDLKYALTYLATKGSVPQGRGVAASDLEWVTSARDYVLSFVEGNSVYETVRTSSPVQLLSRGVRKSLGFNKDGKMTASDYLITYQRSTKYCDAHRKQLDQYLPFAGQCAFGVVCGWILGRVAHKTFQAKFTICALGAVGYFGFQYLAESQMINKDVVRRQVKDGVKKALDVNGDGTIDRKDIEELVGRNLSVVKEKLGPDMFAPGMVGVATFCLGMLRGVRII